MDSRNDGAGPTRTFPLAAIALISSALLFYFGTGFAPIGGLTWFAPLPVLLLAPRASTKITAGVAALAYALGTTNSWGLYWHSIDVPLPMAAVIVVGGSLMFMLVVLLFRALARRGRALLATVSAPALWVTALYLTSVASPSGIQGTFATDQADVPLVLQIASITGGWGVEFLVLLVPTAVAALLAPGMATAARLRTGALTGLVVVLALGYGAVRLSDNGATEPPQRVALLAMNQPQWGTDVASPIGQQRIAAYGEQITRIPGGAGMVVLPEGGFAADDTSLPQLVGPLSRVAQAQRTDIVVGLILTTQGGRFNTAVDIPADGSKPVAYHKWHDNGSSIQVGHDLAFAPGTENRVGMAVCMDVNFPAPTRNYADAGTQLIAIPAADEDVSGWQHSRTALLRGVENGLAVAWSAQRGTLMVSDPWGRVLADASTDAGAGAAFASTVADVRAGSGPTVYTRFGDWFVWLCIALTLSGLIGTAVPQNRRRTTEDPNSGVPDTAVALR